MDDRIAEIREALDDWGQEYVWLLRSYSPKVTLKPLEVIVDAARAYVELLDSDALIIRRDENGEWPYPQVTGDWLVRLANGTAIAGGSPGATGRLDKTYSRDQADLLYAICKELGTYGDVILVPVASSQGVEP